MKPKAYELSKSADLDLKNILVQGARMFARKHAITYARDLEQALADIAEYPLANRERKELHPPHRICLFQAHLIFYLVEPNRIFVTRILHGRQEWQSGLE
jgi:toxin ParE1/3/4